MWSARAVQQHNKPFKMETKAEKKKNTFDIWEGHVKLKNNKYCEKTHMQSG